MKSQMCIILGMVILGGALLTGCSTEPHHPVTVTPTGQVFVPATPPTPRVESPGSPPEASDVWVPGYWTYHDARWVWLPGHWQAPAQSGQTWVAGHWDHTERGWLWTPGHWE